jgi:hypothetical protein
MFERSPRAPGIKILGIAVSFFPLKSSAAFSPESGLSPSPAPRISSKTD